MRMLNRREMLRRTLALVGAALPFGSLPTSASPLRMRLERQLLGWMIIDPSRLAEIAQIRSAINLKSSAHKVIFRALLARFDAQPYGMLDLVVLSHDLESSGRGLLERAGGRRYLLSVVETVQGLATRL